MSARISATHDAGYRSYCALFYPAWRSTGSITAVIISYQFAGVKKGNDICLAEYDAKWYWAIHTVYDCFEVCCAGTYLWNIPKKHAGNVYVLWSVQISVRYTAKTALRCVCFAFLLVVVGHGGPFYWNSRSGQEPNSIWGQIDQCVLFRNYADDGVAGLLFSSCLRQCLR